MLKTTITTGKQRTKEYRRAIQLDPQYATAHQWYAECLAFQGRFPYVEKGMFPKALPETSKSRHGDGGPVSKVEAYVYGRWGKQQQAERALAQWKQESLGGRWRLL